MYIYCSFTNACMQIVSSVIALYMQYVLCVYVLECITVYCNIPRNSNTRQDSNRDFQSEAGVFRFGTETCQVHKGEGKTLNQTQEPHELT